MQRSRTQGGLRLLRGTDQGFSLIELMVGLAVAFIVIIAGYTVLTGANKSTRANEHTVDTQQNARIAMEVITQDLKMAGFGMIGPVGGCANPIVPNDKVPGGLLTDINDDGPDGISLVIPTLSGTISAVAPVVAGTSFDTISVSGGIAAGSIISIGGAMTATVNTVGPVKLSAYIPAPVTFPIGTPVYTLQCIVYSIGTTAAMCPGSNAPCLLRAGAPITDGIEDIQFAFGCDGCVPTINAGVPDKIIDDQNAGGTFDQADFVSNSSWATPPMTPDKIRLVQVTIVARQTVVDQGLGEGNRSGVLTPAALQVSDHLHTVTPTYQQFRRRVLTRTVETRNMGL